MHSSSIEILLGDARQGSIEAMGALLESCRHYLLHVAVRSLQGELQAKIAPSDLVQESLLDAQLHFGDFRGENEAVLLSWLKRILLSKIANAYRFYHSDKRNSRRETPIAETDEIAGNQMGIALPDRRPNQTSNWAIEESELAEHLRISIASLPDDQREILHMRYYEKLTFAQISARLSRPEETVRRHWAKAISALQNKMRGFE